ncbi:hypothetical protein Y1Q_0019746 [Alligator mississippiensis]|uniref:Uncharacterized protein n=1 Tax=Alligator mississippiensis TaxID=8496 RepID=A0A151PEX4_ALLMI|nr:hypothetical protein Y1Q_0019746 [Alligator mississippiensis]
MQDIMRAHLDMMGQLVTMRHGFVPPSQQLDVQHKATYRTLALPSVLEEATCFHVAKEDKAIQVGMDTEVLWHHVQTIECQFCACATSSNWQEQIILDICDNEHRLLGLSTHFRYGSTRDWTNIIPRSSLKHLKCFLLLAQPPKGLPSVKPCLNPGSQFP